MSIDPGTVAVLTEHRRRQDAERELAGTLWVGGDHVFRRELGEPSVPRHPDRADGQAATPAQHRRRQGRRTGAAGDPVARPAPPARHPAPEGRRTVHVVAARLGHADPAITLRVYAHVLDDQASGAATTFEHLINGTATRRSSDR